ncbi:MAG: hypothetical protein KGH56_01020 [Patescibacteria group bacterium]|nr:hypothetical protein [Patescibacteria group bacterium]
MQFADFQKFINEQDNLLRQAIHTGLSEKEIALTRTVKLGEEFGELCDEVLASFGNQRTGKMEKKDADGLADEFADVTIVTFLLAKSMNIDIMNALARKIEKIKTKHNQQLN